MTNEFLKSFVPRIETRWSVLRLHLLPMVLIAVGIAAVHYLTVMVTRGWFSYWGSASALFLIGATALARVNDIEYSKTQVRWQIRRAGFIFVFVSCMWLGAGPVIDWMNGIAPDFPAWHEVMLRWGVFFVWLTTPMLPPWHRYMSGEFRKVRIEVPDDVQVDVIRTETTPDGAIFVDRRKVAIDPKDEAGP